MGADPARGQGVGWGQGVGSLLIPAADYFKLRAGQEKSMKSLTKYRVDRHVILATLNVVFGFACGAFVGAAWFHRMLFAYPFGIW